MLFLGPPVLSLEYNLDEESPRESVKRRFSLQPETAEFAEMKRFSRSEPLSSNWQPKRTSTISRGRRFILKIVIL